MADMYDIRCMHLSVRHVPTPVALLPELSLLKAAALSLIFYSFKYLLYPIFFHLLSFLFCSIAFYSDSSIYLLNLDFFISRCILAARGRLIQCSIHHVPDTLITLPQRANPPCISDFTSDLTNLNILYRKSIDVLLS